MFRSKFLTLLVAFAMNQNFSAESRIIVDFAHSELAETGGKQAPPYRVSTCECLVVDAKGFKFPKRHFPEVSPNVVQLLIEVDRQYWADWGESGVTNLSRATLKPMASDIPPFTGLKVGDTAVVLIGYQSIDPVTKEPVLKKRLWLGIVEVR